MEGIISFRDIQTHDYENSKSLLSFLTKTKEEFSLESFTELCSSLNSNHRIICCVFNDIESGLNTMVAMGTFLIEKKLIHNCGCVGHIEDVVVHENYRNINVGKALIEYMINIAKERQAYKVILNCNEGNTDFYRKCGFHKNNLQMRIDI